MKPCGIRLVRQTRSQTEVEIRRRLDRAQTADDLPQLRLLLVKLAALTTLLKMLRRGDAELIAQRQLVEFATNCFTFCFLHNLTYK